MRRAIPAVAISAILAGAAGSVFADPQFSGPYGTGGSYNVYEFVRSSSMRFLDSKRHRRPGRRRFRHSAQLTTIRAFISHDTTST